MKNKYKKSFGFSLLELMIILAITALLVQLAIPSYQVHIKKTKNLEAQVQDMEEEIITLSPKSQK
jgi:Tfp pilus assembly protein PilE